MKIRKWAGLLLAMAPLLSGCKGFWNAPSSSSGGDGTASGVFYVLNQTTSQIAGYSFSSGATTPTAVTNSPYDLGAVAPLSMAANGSYLYVGTASGILVYSIGSGGVLTALTNGSSSVISTDQAFTMQVDPSGKWLIEAISGIAALYAIPLDTSTGLNVTGASEQLVDLPSGVASSSSIQLAVTPANSTNSYVFVAMGTLGTAVIPFNASSTGNPFSSVGSTIKPRGGSPAAATAVAVDVSTTRPLLYIGETVALSGSNPGGLRVFTIGASSSMTEVSGTPYGTGGIGPSAILPTTNYVYVANKSVSGSSSGNVTGFAITSTGTVYSLTAITSGTISAGTSTVGLAEDNTGTYILAVNSGGSPDLNAYTIGTTGALTSYATPSTGTDPVGAVSIVAVP